MNKRGQRHVHELVHTYSPKMFVVLETHSPFEKVKDFWHELGFVEFGVMEASSHRGGIWVLGVEILSLSYHVEDYFEQMVSLRLHGGGKEWVFSAVYPVPSIRERLWNHIKIVHQGVQAPWMVVGDFNEIISPLKVWGKGSIFMPGSF